LFIAFSNKKYLTVLLVLLVILTSPLSISADAVKLPAFSPDIHLDHSKGSVADEQSAQINISTLVLVNIGDLPDAADVDALHGLPNGDVLFSLETSIELAGVLYRPNDVIRYDGASWSKEFNGSGEGVPDGVNVDAIAKSGETLMFSIDVDANFGGITVNDADIIAFNGIEFSVFLSASTSGISQASDIDALHINDQGRVLVSLDGAGTEGGVQYRDEDLLAWDSPNWSMEFDGSSDDAAWQAADLDAWSNAFLDDNLFSDSFEGN